MSEEDIETSRKSLVDKASGHVHWLIDPNRGLLLPLTGVWILGLDWLLFSSNLLSAGLATPIVIVLGFVVGGLGTFLLQKYVAGETFGGALLKAFIAGIVVGVPWPLSGTFVGGWILLAAGMKNSKRNE